MHHFISVLKLGSLRLSLGELRGRINCWSMTMTFWSGLGFKQKTVMITGFRHNNYI